MTSMIDEFTSGKTVSRIMINAKGKPNTHVLLSCNVCNFKIKTMAALKNHIVKNHQTGNTKCKICGFESSEADMEDHRSEFST